MAGLAWIDTKRTTLTLQPWAPGALGDAPARLDGGAAADAPALLATFNSGFKLADSHGGFALDGHTYAPMRDGQGTLVGYADGRVDVVDWSYGATRPGGASASRARTCR